MTQVTGNRPKVAVWFWVISLIGLLYFFMDASMFYMRVSLPESFLNSMPASQQALYENMPAWVNGVFSLEVFGGLFGSISLLLRKRWALPLFIISIAGVLAQSIYIWFLSDTVSVMGNAAVVMPMVAIVIGLAYILFSKSSISRGWLQ